MLRFRRGLGTRQSYKGFPRNLGDPAQSRSESGYRKAYFKSCGMLIGGKS